MNTTIKIYTTAIMFLAFTRISFGQKNTPRTDRADYSKTVVHQLNAPTKMWVNGGWIIQENGERVWQKGNWTFEERTFQQKSEHYRRKMNNRNRV